MRSFFSLWSRIFCAALVLKLGGAPFHSWLPSLRRRLSWDSLFILLTIQKINPLLILRMYSPHSYGVLMVSGVISILLGSLTGLFQVQTRKILVYSSINQAGWLFFSILLSLKILSVFFFIYIISLLPVILSLRATNTNLLKQASLLPKKKVEMILFLNLLSLGGLPPFLGFFPKWLVLSEMTGLLPFFASVMIFSRLLTLFFYLRISVHSFLNSEAHWKRREDCCFSFRLLLFTQISLGGLFICSIL